MADVLHRNLTGADLHEPKGIETAAAGEVYVADGSGSGTWMDPQDVVGNLVNAVSGFANPGSKLPLPEGVSLSNAHWVIVPASVGCINATSTNKVATGTETVTGSRKTTVAGGETTTYQKGDIMSYTTFQEFSSVYDDILIRIVERGVYYLVIGG